MIMNARVAAGGLLQELEAQRAAVLQAEAEAEVAALVEAEGVTLAEDALGLRLPPIDDAGVSALCAGAVQCSSNAGRRE